MKGFIRRLVRALTVFVLLACMVPALFIVQPGGTVKAADIGTAKPASDTPECFDISITVAKTGTNTFSGQSHLTKPNNKKAICKGVLE